MSENSGQLAGSRAGHLDATMIVVGSMIGSGIFITSADRPAWLELPAGSWPPGRWRAS